MRLPIADCRLPIAESGAGGGFARGGHDGSEVVGFLQQRGQFALGNDSRFGKQFEPKRGFIRFFLNDSDFGDEFRFASSAAGRAVVRGDRGTTADDLFCDNSSCVVRSGNGPGQFNYSKSKGFGALFKFSWVHRRKLQVQSPIANRQSSITV